MPDATLISFWFGLMLLCIGRVLAFGLFGCF